MVSCDFMENGAYPKLAISMAIRPGWGQGCLRLSFLAPKRTSMAPSSICKWGPMSVEEDGHGMSWQWVILTEGPKGKSHCDQRLLLEDFAQRIQRFCPLICRFSQMGVPQDHPSHYTFPVLKPTLTLGILHLNGSNSLKFCQTTSQVTWKTTLQSIPDMHHT